MFWDLLRNFITLSGPHYSAPLVLCLFLILECFGVLCHLTGNLLLNCYVDSVKTPGAEQMLVPENRALSQTTEQEIRRSPGAEVPRKPSDCTWWRMPHILWADTSDSIWLWQLPPLERLSLKMLLIFHQMVWFLIAKVVLPYPWSDLVPHQRGRQCGKALCLKLEWLRGLEGVVLRSSLLGTYH